MTQATKNSFTENEAGYRCNNCGSVKPWPREVINAPDPHAKIYAKLNAARCDHKVTGQYIIVGAGDVANHIMESSCKSDIVAVADNDPSKHGADFHGFTIRSVADVVAEYGTDAAYLVCVYNNSQVRNQLAELGCTSVKPFVTYWREHREDLPKLGCLTDDRAVMSTEAADVKRAFDIWADEESTSTFISLFEFHMSPQYRPVLNPRPYSDMYFDNTVYQFGDNEVFFDGGAYDGDTIREIFKLKPDFQGHIVAIEPDHKNSWRLRNYVESDGISEQVSIFNGVVSDNFGSVPFNATGGMGSSIGGDGTSTVTATTIDILACSITPTVIKLDIEGAEIDALNGAAETIKRDTPVLAVCAYHKLSDLWRIPLLIKKLNPAYKLYLRRYAEDCWETVIYAVARTD